MIEISSVNLNTISRNTLQYAIKVPLDTLVIPIALPTTKISKRGKLHLIRNKVN